LEHPTKATTSLSIVSSTEASPITNLVWERWLSTTGVIVVWNTVKGGGFPWDIRYYQENPDTSTGFDPEYVMRHDSAPNAGTMATGRKAAVNMLLYEENISTLVEDAMYCGLAGDVVTTFPIAWPLSSIRTTVPTASLL
jgi:hypothetical protein